MSRCWMYGPDGAAEIFESAGDAPDGWADHPSKVKKSGEKAVSVAEEAQTADDGAEGALAPDVPAEFAKFDRDGNGKPGGSKPRRKVKRRGPRK